MTQTRSTFRRNRDLFSNHYLTTHLPDTEQWRDVADEDIRTVYENIRDIYESEREMVTGYNEASLQRNFIDPVLEELSITVEIEETVEGGQKRPDYAFFPDDRTRRDAFELRDASGSFYEHAIAVADAKRWGRKLDTRGERVRDFENPSYQIHVYLQETPARWAVLTNGEKWRLYYGPTSHRLDSYYEIDLPTLLEQGGLEEFRYFYLFFRREAFVEDASGDCFLDHVYDESNTFAETLGEDLQENIYEAIRVLGEGFLQYQENDLEEETLERRDLLPENYSDFEQARLDLIHDSSLIYLYRLIFILYAESEGRELLPTDDEIYNEHYSLNELKHEITENLDDSQKQYLSWKTNIWTRLDELFDLINEGSESQGIERDQLHVPAYNGGLFRTDPDEDDGVEANFLSTYKVGDAHLSKVLELLSRREAESGRGKVFVDYSSLDIRHLGSIYEGLLEYRLNVAKEPLSIDDGEYVPAGEENEIIADEGEVYLTTDSGERKETGSYYTPEYVVEYIVESTLQPLVDDIREDLVGYDSYSEGGFAEEFAERIFELKVLDPAMGSGHFLVNAVDYLARKIIDAQERQDQQAIQAGNEEAISDPTTKEGELRDINWARRKVAQRCIYGVDLNPLATELAKVSLWLRTLAAEQPLAFLDHHLKTGNSVIGSDVENILNNGSLKRENGQLTLQQSFDRKRQQALEHVMERFQDLLSIDNETLEDIKEMEDVYEEIRIAPLYQRLLSMANVHTAETLGLSVPGEAYTEMAQALRGDAWNEIEGRDWFRSAQAMAGEERFFHWKLEFPVVFYTEGGNRKENPGFDATFGNPPYVISFDENQKQFLEAEYPSFVRNNDLYTAFTQKGIELCREGGMFSYITPNTYLTGEYFDALKEFALQNAEIRSLIDFGTYSVFPDADVYCSIVVAKRRSEVDQQQQVSYRLHESKIERLDEEPLETDTLTVSPDDDWQPDMHPIAVKCASKSNLDLTDVSFVKDVGLNYWTEGRGKVRGEGSIGDRVLYDGEPEHEDDVPYIKGSDFDRFVTPETGNHWLRHDWEDRLDSEVDTFRFSPEYLTVDEKILYRQTADKIIATIDTSGSLVDKTVHTVLLNDEAPDWLEHRAIVALMNSKLYNFVYREMIDEEGRSFAQVKRYRIQELPLPEMDSLSSVADRLVSLSAEIREYKDEIRTYNMDVKEYFSQNPSGEKLGRIAQPASGVTDSILDDTKEDRNNIRVGSVRIDTEDNKVILQITVRYKPEDSDDEKTDRWGYVESDFIPALEVVGASEAEAVLIEDFVPVAVQEGSGFADFRKKATQKKSPLDRLSKLTLPDRDENRHSLDRYIENRSTVASLNDKCEMRRREMNQIIYDLFDLEEDEISSVEGAIGE